MSIAIYNAALVMHIIGIVLMSGTTFIDFITFRAFLSIYNIDASKGIVMENYLNKLQRFLGLGMLIIIISGVIMMIKLHEVWGAQIWFRLKIGILVLIIINGLGFRRILGVRLKKRLEADLSGNPVPHKWDSIKRNFMVVELVQMSLLVLIYILSTYKFN